MKTFVINLDKDIVRLQAIDEQLSRLGVPYERVRAICAKEFPLATLRSRVNQFRWWCAVGRPVRIGEIGCALSHYHIYSSLSEPVCVLEDDAILSDEFPKVLKFVFLQIDATKPQVVLLSNHIGDQCESSTTGTPMVCRCNDDKFAEGYVITPPAAKALLKANLPLQVPCDWWGRWAKRGIIELYHAFPTVCRQDQSQYVSGTVDSNSFCVADLSFPRLLLHKTKRIVGKTLDKILSQ